MDPEDDNTLSDAESASLPADSDATSEEIGDAASSSEGAESEVKRLTLVQRIKRLTITQRIHLATLGSREERFILIRDQNKLISRAVASSPKATESEVAVYASMTDVTEDVFRIIAKNPNFMKSYGVVRALVRNPHVPLDVSLPLMNRLNARDIKEVEIDKNLKSALRSVAAKLRRSRQ